ncbi:uroporphyrinogen-III synthase [Pseudolysobacter antarcticus]|uniref:Uroporphyrinogen-III synthase n=2 Tax=Pseudolysobacter antarcticus TaxID=2511995 RepID=A0A411HF33_9GAMM|nr:uroporphyrinogen-III synthase [Pseudolysobacter antarcticus]
MSATAVGGNAAALAGASVIVTRPVGGGDALKRRILNLGGRALSLPGSSLRALVDTPALRAQLRAARDADRVIFSSPAAVRFAFALWPALRFGRSTQVFGVGAATGRALSRLGMVNAVTPSRQDSEGLLALPQLKQLRGLRVALIGAPGGRELLPQSLIRRGAQLTRIGVYQRLPPRLNRRHFAAIETLSAPCFLLLSSEQTLANICHVLPADILARLHPVEVIASSARVAVAARECGFASVTLARSAASDDLIAAAIGALARHRL